MIATHLGGNQPMTPNVPKERIIELKEIFSCDCLPYGYEDWDNFNTALSYWLAETLKQAKSQERSRIHKAVWSKIPPTVIDGVDYISYSDFVERLEETKP